MPQKQAVAEAALQVIDEALAEDSFDLAKQVGRLAVQVARLSKDGDLIRSIAAKNKEVETAAKAHAAAGATMAVLREKPTDPDANLTVGKYLCFTKGDWEKGLPLLALGSNAALKQLAQQDIKEPTTPEDQVKLGDAWWDVEGKQRAVYWYEQALPSLAGLQQERVAKKIEEAAGQAAAAGKWTVIFRSANPKIWNTAFKNGKETAVPVANVSNRIKYLKISCDKGSVIVPVNKDKLLRSFAQASSTASLRSIDHNM